MRLWPFPKRQGRWRPADSQPWGTFQTHLGRVDARLTSAAEEIEKARRVLSREVPEPVMAARDRLEDLQLRYDRLLREMWAVVDFCTLLAGEAGQPGAATRRLLRALEDCGIAPIDAVIGAEARVGDCELRDGTATMGTVAEVKRLGFRDVRTGEVLRRAVVTVACERERQAKEGEKPDA